MLHGDFKAGALDSIQGHFRECGHPVFTGIFLGCIQQTQAALQHACRETISTRNSVLVLPCRELWLHAHSYQNLATDTPTIIRLGYRNTDYYQTCRTCITFPKARQLAGVFCHLQFSCRQKIHHHLPPNIGPGTSVAVLHLGSLLPEVSGSLFSNFPGTKN